MAGLAKDQGMELVLDLNDSSVKKQIREQVLAILQNTLNDPKNAKKFKGIGNTGMIGNADKARPDLKKLTKFGAGAEIQGDLNDVKKLFSKDIKLDADIKIFNKWMKDNKLDTSDDIDIKKLTESVNELSVDLSMLGNFNTKNINTTTDELALLGAELKKSKDILGDIDDVGGSLIKKYMKGFNLPVSVNDNGNILKKLTLKQELNANDLNKIFTAIKESNPDLKNLKKTGNATKDNLMSQLTFLAKSHNKINNKINNISQKE